MRITADQPTAHEEERGVVFNRLRTILLAERYTPVQFVVPFPAYAHNITERLTKAASALEDLWNMPTYDCDLISMAIKTDNHTSALIAEAFAENELAEKETKNLLIEASMLLPSRATESEGVTRPKRFIMIAAGLAVAGILGLGLGASLGSSCFLHGVFGTCPDNALRSNSFNVQRTMREMNLQRRHWVKLQADLDEKFYVIGDTVTELHSRQEEVVRGKERIWNETHAAINILQNNTRVLRLCDAYLFTRTQANHIRTSILAEVDSLISGIRSYRAALVAYRINLLNSISHLSLGRLPLSLVERETLGEILTEVATGELHTPDRLTLAVPLDELLAYYEMNLVERVYTTSEGLIIRFLIPLTSRELVLDVYEATPLPMPNPENESYTQWKIPAPFFAVSATHKEHAILTQEQLSSCLGTKQLAICHQGFPVQRNRESCLASLFYSSHSAAFSFCDIETLPLPTNPTARNLGFGRWLLLARSADYSLSGV